MDKMAEMKNLIAGLVVSHVIVIIGLILFTLGTTGANNTLLLAGIWIFAVGICIGTFSGLAHVLAKMKSKDTSA